LPEQKNIIIGRKPVYEALTAGVDLDRIYLLQHQKGEYFHKIKSLAKQNGVTIHEVPQQKINSLSSHPNTQGVIAYKSLIEFSSLEEILTESKNYNNPVVLICEQIQDTHNLGAIFRSAEASGVAGVFITKHNSAPISEIVEKTSAGAVSHLKIAEISNVVNLIKELKENGFWVVGTTLANSQVYTSVDYQSPIALIVSNEEKGIRKLTAENCDFLVNIPMKGNIQSLNVSVAAGIILFEIERQKNSK
jgi:23S rRNA (guanosine2251-2'-O)-methyltransferase